MGFQQNIHLILMNKKRGAHMSKVKTKYQVSPIFVFFLIHSAQFGAGVLDLHASSQKLQDTMAGLVFSSQESSFTFSFG